MATPLELIDRARALAGTGGRADLERRLALVRERVGAASVRVLVVGEPKQGKSQLVNALVGAPVCPVADDVATVVPTVIREGAAPRAVLVHSGATGGAGDGRAAPAAEEPVERTPVPIESLSARTTRGADDDDGRHLVRAEVELPRRFLAGGLELVDTAGVGGIGTGHSLQTVDLLPSAHAVLVVSDASQEYTGPEMAFIRQAVALCPTVVFAVTKTDVHPSWRSIVELDRAHLRRQGIEAPLFPVSASLGILAVQHKDTELHAESGLAPLAEHLRREVLGRAEALRQRSTVHDLRSVAEQLTLSLRAELAALEDPAGNDALVEELTQARARVEELRRRSSRWQQMLGDGVTDLMADIDYDLRDRSRVLIREAEEAIDARDPGPTWAEFTEWLDERLATAVTDSYVWAGQRSEYLAEQVVEQFARDGGVVAPELDIGSPAEALGALVDVASMDDGFLPVRERLLIGLRGSYTGVLMTGLVTSLAGLAVINPLSLAVGVVLGRKAYQDDKAARRQRRQTEAKQIVRRHLDEVVFQVGKQLKDQLRMVQRTLRDLITDTVDELSRTLGDALAAAQRSTKAAAAERTARIRAVRAQLEVLDRFAKEVARLEAAPAALR
ncbi:dynamin family protein [Blastococcus capsensis]|uniref:dynamin family protein n=1 Tax=Blastococcus capsensis TaxID=1564163 RepID=UPI0025416B5F|nr:dynamin family protein [Blastococcus capsensis]MDK3255093.1 dynamin family protein [Blastococcus capsensis]